MAKMGNIDDAIELYEKKEFKKALEILDTLNDINAKTLMYKGLCLIELEEYKKAYTVLSKALKIEETPKIKGALGLCYYKLKAPVSAKKYLSGSIVEEFNLEYASLLEKILISENDKTGLLGLKLLEYENNKKDTRVLRELAEIASAARKYEIALEANKALVELCPKNDIAMNNIGSAYESLLDWKNAVLFYKKALALNDSYWPNYNLGVISRKMHRLDDAIKYLRKAACKDPSSNSAKFSLAMTYLASGDFKRGYPIFLKSLVKIAPQYQQKIWKGGKQKEKSILVLIEGGFGDIIMFSRYLNYLPEYFKKVRALAPCTLYNLYKYNFPEFEILNPDKPVENIECVTSQMSIVKTLNLDFTKSVPFSDGYLKVRPELIEKFKEKFFKNDKIKIAICYHGNTNAKRTLVNRSMPLEFLEPVFNKFREKAVFYSIQKDEARIELKKYPFIVDLYDEINNFEDTAAILKNVDFLITIDSSPVHMAGALGVKTFLLLPYAAEWRWFPLGNKTKWYNSVEIFRQNKESDWKSAIDKLILQLN